MGFLQQRGWDTKPANEVVFQAIKSYREAAAHIGVPPDQILRMPKDAADELLTGPYAGEVGARATRIANLFRASGGLTS